MQHRADDQPVKRQDGRKINSAQQIVRQHQRRRRDAAADIRVSHVHHQAKIQMAIVEAGHQPFGRLAHHRKNPDKPNAPGAASHRRF